MYSITSKRRCDHIWATMLYSYGYYDQEVWKECQQCNKQLEDFDLSTEIKGKDGKTVVRNDVFGGGTPDSDDEI